MARKFPNLERVPLQPPPHFALSLLALRPSQVRPERPTLSLWAQSGLGFADRHPAQPAPTRVRWPRRNPAPNPHWPRQSPQTAAFVYWSEAWSEISELTPVMFHVTHLSRAQPTNPLFSPFFPLSFLISFVPPLPLWHPNAIKSTPRSHLAGPAAGLEGGGGREREPRVEAAGDLGRAAEKPEDWGRAFLKDSTGRTDCAFILITCHFYPTPSKLCPGEKST